MQWIDIYEANRYLSRLVAAAAQGESFVIARDGRPLVKVTAVVASEARGRRRTGFLAGQIGVSNDFDRMGAAEIDTLFRNPA